MAEHYTEREREMAQRLHKETGYSVYECRKALFIADNDLERAREYLASSDWKQSRNELRGFQPGAYVFDDIVRK